MNKKVRNILLNYAHRIKERDVAVMLSGGVDSSSILFSLLEAGKNVTAYTFVLEGHKSTDFTSSKKVCETFEIPFVPVYLPTNVKTIEKDVRNLIVNRGLSKKTDIECTWAMKYAMREVKEKVIVTGHGADGHFGLSKRAMIHHSHSLEALNEFRDKTFNNPNYAQKLTLQEIAKENKQEIVFPYLEKEMRKIFHNKSWEELNKPKQKNPIVESFPEYFEKIKIRKHTVFQLGDSKIAENFQQLVHTDLNQKGYKSPVGIYNAIRRREV